MLIRKLFRTAWKYKAQFISMIIMVTIGLGVFVGFNIEWYSLEKDTNEFFESTKFADYRIYSEYGFTEADIEAIKDIEGVDAASRILSVNVDVKGTEDALSLFTAEDYVVSTMLITEGAEYDKESDDFWLSDRYAEANDIKLGDSLTLVYRGIEISGKVCGLVKSSEYMICVADENQLMPDFDTFGFVYISPERLFKILGMEFYPQINIRSEIDKAEMEEKVAEALGKTTLVLSKAENMSYAGAQSEIEEGKTMGTLIPILFLMIALLAMITTMHRITANEKIQIGTLKALGFKDRRILWHYTSYGFSISVVASTLGAVLGFYIAGIVINPDGMMGTYIDMPSWKLYMPGFCMVVMAVGVAALTFIGYLSVRKMLKGTAAEALRPYTPKKMKQLLIEKTGFWKKLAFGTRWNLRDIMRHKARSSMTLLGIISCTLLIVGVLGMKDTMAAFMDMIDKEINNYVTKVNIAEGADNEEIEAFAKEQKGDWSAQLSIKLGEKAITLDIYETNYDKMRFIDENDNRVTLGDEGAYICIRLADEYEVGDMIEFSPYGSEETYSVKVAGVIRSVMTENITITKEYAEKIGIPYQIGAVYTDTEQGKIADADFISGKQSKQALMDSYNSFMELLDMMVIIFIIGALILGTVVLYNLGVMSYIERSRELATLKVVGFRDKHIGKILISQNVWLTVLGVIVGIPGGAVVLKVLLKMLASEYELCMKMGALTFVVSIVLTFGISLIVGLFVARKNKKIDMVEALKGAE